MADEVIGAIGADPARVKGESYLAMIELTSLPAPEAIGAARALESLRERLRAAGGAALGVGLHPAAALGDVVNRTGRHYDETDDLVGWYARRTPEAALHVHVGMPDAEAAIRACDALREWVPLLVALSANSPFLHGSDSGLAAARPRQNTAYPRAGVPPAFGAWAEYEAAVREVAEAADCDYEQIWWLVRPHPRLGTVEVRPMDSQSSLGAAAGLAALVQGVAVRAASSPPARASRREVIEEWSYRAARHGMEGPVPTPEGPVPARDAARALVAEVRPALREIGAEAALEEVERLLATGGGASRQRRAHRDGGMAGLLSFLADDTATRLGVTAS